LKTEITLQGDKKQVEALKEMIAQLFKVEWGEPYEDTILGTVRLRGYVSEDARMELKTGIPFQ